MQSVINTVKGTALGVAEYLTPVLKVCFSHAQIYDFELYRFSFSVHILQFTFLTLLM